MQPRRRRAFEPGLVVADRRRRDQLAVRPDAGHLNHRDVERTEETLPRHRRDLAQVHVEIVHLAAVDAVAHVRIGIVRQAVFDAVDLGQRAVEFGPGRCAGPDGHLERPAGFVFGLDTSGKRQRNGLGIAGAGEAAHADGVVRFDQRRRVIGAHHFAAHDIAVDFEIDALCPQGCRSSRPAKVEAEEAWIARARP